ncbi:MAG: hypothetical protein JSV23_03085 [Promethearchaeota archaeon]|nr:MAG: hypothetical protein JSV23_03085 [Candidatus Lokiarchaeota archaeon]
MNEKETRIFNCDLNETNLFNCILEEVGEKDLNTLSTTAPLLHDKSYINCINASLVTCLRNNREELDFHQIQLQIIRNEIGDWLINQINIIVDKQIDDDLISKRINQCLKFVKRGCRIDDSIEISIIHSEIKQDLKYFEVELTEIDHLLQQIRDDKLKKEKLFSIFRYMDSNK